MNWNLREFMSKELDDEEEEVVELKDFFSWVMEWRRCIKGFVGVLVEKTSSGYDLFVNLE